MKYLGIDYGTKKVGTALSDDGGSLAFPYTVIKNDTLLLDNIAALCAGEHVAEIVVGESLANTGEENRVMTEIKKFIERLEDRLSIPVHLEREWMSSVGSRIPPLSAEEGKAIKKNEKGVQTDDRAAAIILQRFLDRNNKK